MDPPRSLAPPHCKFPLCTTAAMHCRSPIWDLLQNYVGLILSLKSFQRWVKKGMRLCSVNRNINHEFPGSSFSSVTDSLVLCQIPHQKTVIHTLLYIWAITVNNIHLYVFSPYSYKCMMNGLNIIVEVPMYTNMCNVSWGEIILIHFVMKYRSFK